MTDFDLRPLPD